MNDFLNGMFELGGAVLLLTLNVYALHRDKRVRGVHWGPTAFYTAWGIWNLHYYPAIDQWWSFSCGILVVVANAIWLGQMYYYRGR